MLDAESLHVLQRLRIAHQRAASARASAAPRRLLRRRAEGDRHDRQGDRSYDRHQHYRLPVSSHLVLLPLRVSPTSACPMPDSGAHPVSRSCVHAYCEEPLKEPSAASRDPLSGRLHDAHRRTRLLGSMRRVGPAGCGNTPDAVSDPLDGGRRDPRRRAPCSLERQRPRTAARRRRPRHGPRHRRGRSPRRRHDRPHDRRLPSAQPDPRRRRAGPGRHRRGPHGRGEARRHVVRRARRAGRQAPPARPARPVALRTRLQDTHHRDRQRQGRRRQEHRHREPRHRARGTGSRRRPHRRRCLRPDRPPHDGPPGRAAGDPPGQDGARRRPMA